MTLYEYPTDSPFGELLCHIEDDALVGLYLPVHKHPPSRRGEEITPVHPLLAQVATQLEEYFAGQRKEFDLPLAPQGTPFQRDVWQALLAIPYGETRSYAELAQSIGQPKAVRAVGAANGRNPISIIVPCHRVIGSNGTLTGYAGGLERKQWLLHHEQGSSSSVEAISNISQLSLLF